LQQLSSPTRFLAVALCALLAACASGSSSFAPQGAAGPLAPAATDTAKKSPINVAPRNLIVYTSQTSEVDVDESGASEKFTSTGTKACHGLVTWSPQKAKTKLFRVRVTAGKKTGSCAITFADSHKHTATALVVVKPAPTSAKLLVHRLRAELQGPERCIQSDGRCARRTRRLCRRRRRKGRRPRRVGDRNVRRDARRKTHDLRRRHGR
jgi:hypothetical protein